MIEGLIKLEQKLAEKSIPSFLLVGQPEKRLHEFVHKYKVGVIITDFLPFHINRRWKAELSRIVSVPIFKVDAHNIVLCWLVPPKQEYNVSTFRRKINALLPYFLTEFSNIKLHPYSWNNAISEIVMINMGKDLKPVRELTKILK